MVTTLTPGNLRMLISIYTLQELVKTCVWYHSMATGEVGWLSSWVNPNTRSLQLISGIVHTHYNVLNQPQHQFDLMILPQICLYDSCTPEIIISTSPVMNVCFINTDSKFKEFCKRKFNQVVNHTNNTISLSGTSVLCKSTC